MSIRTIVSSVLSAAILLALPADGLAKSLPAWDKVITDGSKRFKVLKAFNDEAVYDQETGLVWERSPATTLFDWDSSVGICIGSPVGGRRGWRLPSISELMTLSDPSHDTPSLTPGHPFENISTDDNYWSATTSPSDAANAMRERFGTGGGGVITGPKTDLGRRWCVRGPGGSDYLP